MSLTAQLSLSLLWQDVAMLGPVQIISHAEKYLHRRREAYAWFSSEIPFYSPTFATIPQLFLFWLGLAPGCAA